MATTITITDPGDQSNNEGDSVSLPITASDSTSSATLSYAASGLPTGLSINSSSGLISGTAGSGGSWQPTITVGDGTNSATDTFNWDVSSPITITDSGDQAFNAGDTVTVPITATDTNTGTLTFSASGLPTGLTISSSSGTIAGTISSSLASGIYTTTVSVTDNTSTDLDIFNWTIYPGSAVTVANPGTQNNTEGTDIGTLSISAIYTGSGTLTYSAANLPPGLAITPATGAITGTPSAGDDNFSPYTTTVTATDGSYSDSQSFVWNVASPIALTNPGTQNTTEGATISPLALSASYSGSGSLTYSALGLPTGLVLNPTSGTISGTVAPGTAQNGPFAVTVQAAADSYVATQNFTWNITSPISISTIADQTNNEGSTIPTLPVSGTDSVSGATLTYAATGLPLGLEISTSGAITGTVALGAAANSPYAVTVVAEDGTYATTQSFNWTINCPVTIATPADQTNNEGDSANLSLSATDSISGATLVYGVVGLPTGLTINTSTGAITGTIAAGASANGPYSVTVSAGDGTYSALATFNWNVNSPVTFINTPADQTNNVGDTVDVSAVATDSISNHGPLTYSATPLPTGLSINSTSGAITGSPTQGGDWETVITASDGTYSTTDAIDWTINSPITITDQGDQTNGIGDVVSVQITASDTASGTLSYWESGLPTGLGINSSTGLISGTISSSASTTTVYTPTITVSDSTNTAIDTFNWTITSAAPVEISSPGNQTNTAGDEVALQMQTTDTNGGTVLYSATGLPPGVYINGFTGFIFGTIPSTTPSGSYTPTIYAADSGNISSLSFQWTVERPRRGDHDQPG